MQFDSTEAFLKQYLYTQDDNCAKYNTRNFERLLEKYNRITTVPFVGAGTSVPLGIQDWYKLMKIFINKINHNETFKIQLESNVDKKETYPEMADKIYRYLDERDERDIFFNTIKEGMQQKNNTTTLTLIKMALSTCTHLTTNFDNSIECAYDFFKYLEIIYPSIKCPCLEIKYLDKLEDVSQNKGNINEIYYLHADIENNVYIFKTEEYEKYYRHEEGPKNIRNCLRSFFINSNIVFIGFSFEDIYVREQFFKLANDLKRENKLNEETYKLSNSPNFKGKELAHFLIIDTENKDWKELQNQEKYRFFELFENINIYPIVYKTGQHVFIEKLFELLSQRKRGEI